MQTIKVQCPAKINLTLKVLGKRPDGFHNIESIMQTISLFDYLTISLKKADELRIKLTGNSIEIPYNENNLIYKAGKLFFDNLKDYKYEINVNIEKNIPVAAGLAGGSTDAAGMLFGLNELFNKYFSNRQLHNLCAQLGSDLNLCLEGGKQLTKGRGEILEAMNFEPFTLSLIKPVNLGISAKEAYTKFSKNMTASKLGRENFINDLEWAVIDDYEELQLIKKLYPNSIMSGSGSTYYLVNNSFKPQDGFWIKNDLSAIPYGIKSI